MVKASSRERLDRRETHRDGNPDCDSAGRRQHHPDVSRQRRGAMVEGILAGCVEYRPS